MMVVLSGVFKHGLMITLFVFVMMLSQFPGTALALFVLLFISGILFAWISDRIIPIMGIAPCESCIDAHCEECLSVINNQESIRDISRPTNFVNNFQSFSFTLFLLLTVSFLFLIATGILGPSAWNWKRITFAKHALFVIPIRQSPLAGTADRRE